MLKRFAGPVLGAVVALGLAGCTTDPSDVVASWIVGDEPVESEPVDYAIQWETVTVERVVDGDTIWTSAGKVRIIGFDTPEMDACGYSEATALLEQMVAGASTVELGNPNTVVNADQYDRILRYVSIDGEDVGRAMIGAGLAIARYDLTDGYDWHPYQDEYHALDDATEHVCPGWD